MNPSIGIPASEPSPHASTAEAARILGVGVTTVKRWVDEGILPAQRTPGGHRKLLLRDVIRLARSGRVPQADLSPLQASGDLPAIRKRLAKAVDAADFEVIGAVLLGAYCGGHGIEVIADSLVAPELRRVGDCWKSGALTIAEEHRITRAFIAACYGLESHRRPRPAHARPVALGGAPEGDYSILPSLLAKLTLLDAGWDAIDLGPHTPLSEFARALDTERPKLVWLSASHIADTVRFAKEYGDFYRLAAARGIAVAIGGCALTPKLAAGLAYSICGEGFVDLAVFAKSMHDPSRLPVRGRPAGAGNRAD